MSEEIIELPHEEVEVEENNTVNVQPRINQAEMQRLIKRYKKLKRSIFYEIGRIDGAYKNVG